MKLPVTQVPLGLSSEGLPMGIQVVSAPYNDGLTIAVAKHLEKQFGGYVPPFKLENWISLGLIRILFIKLSHDIL